MSATETVTLTRPPTRATNAQPEGAAPAQPVTIPKNLGPVSLTREIGKGGMGTVWLARHNLLVRDVAVKFLLNMVDAADDPGFQGFLEGARAAAAVKHKGLNTVLNADVIEGVPFLVMDYVEGPTLAQLLHQAGKLGPAAVRVILGAACEAVGVLHDHAIIHRDIKPANILIEPDGNPVLTDFGLACTRPAESLGAKSEGVAGTPTYMAPEMFERSISARSDVYALGIMGYELITGVPPFDGTLDDVRRAHRESPLPAEPLAHVPLLAEVLARATNKNPMFRLKNGRLMGHALEEAFSRMDPMLVNKARGESEIAALLARWNGLGASQTTGATPTPNATYYERLGTLVTKRRSDEAAEPGDAPLLNLVPEGTLCARCGKGLAGLLRTGRCPECLLLIRLTLDPAAKDSTQAATATPAAVPGSSGSVPPPPPGRSGSSVMPPSPAAAPAPNPAQPAAEKARNESFFEGVRRFWREFRGE